MTVKDLETPLEHAQAERIAELERRLAEMEAMYDKAAADLIEALDRASAYRATATTLHTEIERRDGAERRKTEASFLVTGQRKNVEDRRKSWPR